MGRPRSVRSSMFTVPRVSKTIDDRSRIPKEITNDPFVREEKKAKNPFELPVVELGKSRTGLLERLRVRGRVTKSESSFAELQQRKFFPTLVHSETDCMDEAELRSRFPKQGVNHKFFNSGAARFQFILPKESDTVVVAQVHWEPKIRIQMNDLSVAVDDGVYSDAMERALVGKSTRNVAVSQLHHDFENRAWNGSTRSSLFVPKSSDDITMCDTLPEETKVPRKRRKHSWCPSWLVPDCLKKQSRSATKSSEQNSCKESARGFLYCSHTLSSTRFQYFRYMGENGADFIDQLSRIGALTCKHRLYNFEKCSICNVILFDKPADMLRDVPFDDMLIASPRFTPLPSDLEATVERMRQENVEIANEATKFKKQIDYVLAQQEQDRLNAPMTPGKDKRISNNVVFEDNIMGDRFILFPKQHSLAPVAKRDVPVDVSETIGDNIIDLTSDASVSTSTLTVYLPPYMREPSTTICVQIDGTVSVGDVIDAIVRRNTELADEWCLRWIDDDEDAPDFELPSIEPDQFVLRLNTNELCMCPSSM